MKFTLIIAGFLFLSSSIVFATIVEEPENNANGVTTNLTDRWDKASRKKFINMCLAQFEDVYDKTEAKRVCDCSLMKLEQKYPSYEAADKAGNEDAIAELIISCLNN